MNETRLEILMPLRLAWPKSSNVTLEELESWVPKLWSWSDEEIAATVAHVRDTRTTQDGAPRYADFNRARQRPAPDSSGPRMARGSDVPAPLPPRDACAAELRRMLDPERVPTPGVFGGVADAIWVGALRQRLARSVGLDQRDVTQGRAVALREGSRAEYERLIGEE